MTESSPLMHSAKLTNSLEAAQGCLPSSPRTGKIVDQSWPSHEHHRSNDFDGNTCIAGYDGGEDEAISASQTQRSSCAREEQRQMRRHFGWKIRRRCFLILTEPDASIASRLAFGFIIVVITASNIINVIQTMSMYQSTPASCAFCNAFGSTAFTVTPERMTTTMAAADDADGSQYPCVCPPVPLPWTDQLLHHLMVILAIEWILRVLVFTMEAPAQSAREAITQWLSFLFINPNTILDALATFPYFLETIDTNGLVSLRLLRLFRILQVFRLSQYHRTFQSLVNVLHKSVPYLQLLLMVLVFGAMVFGSILYWLERGTWKYHEPSQTYQYVRIAVDGISEEISPFRSIPAAFWWFIVTSTTVGYGDYYPTSSMGQWCSCVAMLLGVLVIAFPVSVFSDLWSEEINSEPDVTPHDANRRMLDATQSLDSSHSNRSSPQANRGGSISLMMDVDDVRELQAVLQTLQANEQRLRTILQKYEAGSTPRGAIP